jgi:hypothetical protein
LLSRASALFKPGKWNRNDPIEYGAPDEEASNPQDHPEWDEWREAVGLSRQLSRE